jgi:molybdopterin converting factor small subunit
MQKSVINVELFGMPRIVAGTRRIEASGSALGDILQSAIERAPILRNHITDENGTWLNPGYTFVVDGQFTNDPDHVVSSESDVLLVARASGG